MTLVLRGMSAGRLFGPCDLLVLLDMIGAIGRFGEYEEAMRMVQAFFSTSIQQGQIRKDRLYRRMTLYYYFGSGWYEA